MAETEKQLYDEKEAQWYQDMIEVLDKVHYDQEAEWREVREILCRKKAEVLMRDRE